MNFEIKTVLIHFWLLQLPALWAWKGNTTCENSVSLSVNGYDKISYFKGSSDVKMKEEESESDALVILSTAYVYVIL